MLFHRFITKMLYQKKNKIHHKMQREKLYNLTVKVIVIVFKKRKILCDQFLQCPKSGPSKLCPFWKQKVQLWNRWSCVNCRAFRAASYGMFWSLMQCIKGRKINLSHPLWSSTTSMNDNETNLIENWLPLYYVKYDQIA